MPWPELRNHSRSRDRDALGVAQGEAASAAHHSCCRRRVASRSAVSSAIPEAALASRHSSSQLTRPEKHDGVQGWRRGCTQTAAELAPGTSSAPVAGLASTSACLARFLWNPGHIRAARRDTPFQTTAWQQTFAAPPNGSAISLLAADPFQALFNFRNRIECLRTHVHRGRRVAQGRNND